MLSLRLACILLVSAMVAAKDYDPNKSMKLSFVKPGAKDSKSDTLLVTCEFNIKTGGYQAATSMEIVNAELNAKEIDNKVARIDLRGLTHDDGVDANYKVDKDKKFATLDATWKSKDEGYCQVYSCIVNGTGLDGQTLTISKTKRLRSSDGKRCRSKPKKRPSIGELEEKIEQCCVTSEKVQANAEAIEGCTEKLNQFPEIKEFVEKLSDQLKSLGEEVGALSGVQKTAQENGEEIAALKKELSGLSQEFESNSQEVEAIQSKLDDTKQETELQQDNLKTVLSIDMSKYDVSSLYNGHIYIASKQTIAFNLHDTNEVCKKAGGYLVEFEDKTEQQFVADFMKTIGSNYYRTGANDVEKEGSFVYYNSKKPVTDVHWNKGEPNNSYGNEDCVEIQTSGLNDVPCNRDAKYICEIPLF